MRLNLKILRVKNNLTQIQMAERMGVARSIYTQVENGSRYASPAFSAKLQKTFNIPDAEMWTLLKDYEDGLEGSQ